MTLRMVACGVCAVWLSSVVPGLPQAGAAELHWDGNGLALPDPAGGGGTWNATSLNWFDGAHHQSYSSGAPHQAVFGVTGGGVSIAAPMTATGLRFDASGYTLSGSALTLAGNAAGAEIAVGPGVLATISAALSGATGIDKTGEGVLTLAGANAFAGLNIRGGTVSVATDIALGDAASTVMLDGGTLRVTGAGAVSTATSRALVIGGHGGTIDVQNTTTTGLTLRGRFSGLGTLHKTGNGTLRLDATNNMFIGGVVLQQGTLRFNNNDIAGPKALRASRISFALGDGSALLSLGGTAASELRTGEWHSAAAGAGSIIAATTTTDVAIGARGHDLLIHSLADAEFSGTVANLATSNGGVLGPDSRDGKLGIRGIGVQTLSGVTHINGTISIAGLASLRLAGQAAMTGNEVSANLNGGTLILDNSSTNLPDRFRDSGSVEARGGGRVVFVGHADGSAESLGLILLSTPTAGRPDSGLLGIEIVHNTAAAATTLQFAGLHRTDGRATVDFSARAADGEILELGQAGNAPRVMLTTLPALSAGGLFASPGSAGWATVNGVDFATYDATTGVKPVATVAFALAGAADNALLTGSASLAGATTLGSLKLLPTVGQSLEFQGGASLQAPAILLAGPHDYELRGAAGASGALVAADDQYVFVDQAALRIGVPISGSGALVKSGNGTLILDGQNSYAGPTTINAGTLRAAHGAGLGPGVLELRGGVLEIAGGGIFNRHLDYGVPSGPGLINWTTVIGLPTPDVSKENRGSGGFAAVGADVTVDLNGLGASDIIWEEPAFLSTGYALVLGSRGADARVTLVDNYGLGLSPTSYNAREIRVIDNPHSNSDAARISGIIFSDSAANNGMLTDLLKTGNGALELTGDNTYVGGTIVAEGTLLAGQVNALGRPVDGAYVLLGRASGSASAGLLTSAAIVLNREISVPTGGSGEAVLGTVAAGASSFTGNILIGANAVPGPKQLRLHAAADGTATFWGELLIAHGYTDALTIVKSGPGTVILETAKLPDDHWIVDDGTLEIGSHSLVAESLTIGAGATLVMRSSQAPLTASTAAPVPEPGGFALLAAAGVLAAGWYARRRCPRQ